MTKIISIQPVNDYFSITWNIGIRCNYDCMYCSPKWHDSTSTHKTLEDLKSNWIDIHQKTKQQNKEYKISFTGGEVSANRAFLPFVAWLKSNYPDVKMLLATTNGSATYDYYHKLYTYIDNISFSTHSEHINEEKFFKTVVKLKETIGPNKHIHVNIMNEFWNTDRIAKYQEILNEHGISNIVNEIDYSHSTRTIPIMKGKLNLAIQ
jgi:MoaA/NifB/PqqE/SkfB family radical SAM enzyme